MVTLYNAVSEDGFIARKDGSEDFIPDEVWVDFLGLCKMYDSLVMGRKTYETIQAYPEEMVKEFESLNIKKIVVTKDEKFNVKSGYIIASSPKEAISNGINILLSSGPTLNASVLSQGLVDRVMLNVIPEKIGDGIKQFEIEPGLVLESEQDMGGGRKLSTYKLKK